jgi:hypothetical protein
MQHTVFDVVDTHARYINSQTFKPDPENLWPTRYIYMHYHIKKTSGTVSNV